MLISAIPSSLADWNEPIPVVGESDRPSIMQDSHGKYWVAFNSYRNDANIWVMSSENGSKWGDFIQVTDYNKTDYAPQIIQDMNGEYWIVYAALMNVYNVLEFNYEVRLVHSSNGINWSEPINVTNSPKIDAYPNIMQDDGGRFFITYSSADQESGYTDIYMVVSDNGFTWGEPIRLTDNEDHDIFPIMLQDNNGQYWILFSRDTSAVHPPQMNKYDFFLMVSDDGIHWSNISQLTDLDYNVNYPTFIQDVEGTYWIVYISNALMTEDIAIMGSRDGMNWTEEVLLSNFSAKGWFKTDYKSMMQDDNGLYHVAYTSAQGGRGIWVMNGTPEVDFYINYPIDFNLERISLLNDSQNPIQTLYSEESKGFTGLLSLFIFLFIIIGISEIALILQY